MQKFSKKYDKFVFILDPKISWSRPLPGCYVNYPPGNLLLYPANPFSTRLLLGVKNIGTRLLRILPTRYSLLGRFLSPIDHCYLLSTLPTGYYSEKTLHSIWTPHLTLKCSTLNFHHQFFGIITWNRISIKSSWNLLKIITENDDIA